MKYKTNCRKFTIESHPEFSIRNSKLSPLILIRNNGRVDFANTRTDKDRLILEFNDKEDLLLFAWLGEWRTDVFRLTKKDVKKYYEKIL